jgi:putative Mg2+ transporter-C (MgtC) family protein
MEQRSGAHLRPSTPAAAHATKRSPAAERVRRMRFLSTFDVYALINSAVCFLAAFAFGTLIGAERQYRQRSAGLRTNVLVSLGAAAFVDFGIRVGGPASTQVMAYVVSGIGFLGAGAIMREGLNVRGLNTAATLWCSAAVGAAAGAGLVIESAMLTGFVIAGNTLLRPLVNRINRIPLDEEAGEATYEVRLSVTPEEANEAREALIEALEKAHYPVADVETEERGEDTMEIVATLVATSVVPEELNAVIVGLEKLAGVTHATWESEVQA